MEDALHRLLVVPRLGPKNIRHKRLWIAVIQRKPARLNLHHDPVPGQKNMVRRRQHEAVEQSLVGRDRLRRLQALPVTPSSAGKKLLADSIHSRCRADLMVAPRAGSLPSTQFLTVFPSKRFSPK